jgi:hypothetical protein
MQKLKKFDKIMERTINMCQEALGGGGLWVWASIEAVVEVE